MVNSFVPVKIRVWGYMIPESILSKERRDISREFVFKKASKFQKYRSLEFPPILVGEHPELDSSAVDIFIGF